MSKFNDAALVSIVRSVLKYDDRNIVEICNKSHNSELSVTERNLLLDYVKNNKPRHKAKSTAQIRKEILTLIGVDKQRSSYNSITYLNREEMEAVLVFVSRAVSEGVKP